MINSSSLKLIDVTKCFLPQAEVGCSKGRLGSWIISRLGINSMKWNGSSRPHLSMKPLVSQSFHRFRAHFWNGCCSGLFASPLNSSWKPALQSHWSFAFKPTLLLKKTDEPGKRNVMELTVCLHKYGENLRFSELASYEVCAFSCSTCQGT